MPSPVLYVTWPRVIIVPENRVGGPLYLGVLLWVER
jgi:hypothetical protein